jgi:hypothetical protein
METVDEYTEGGRAVVYSEAGMVVLLSELASVAWAALNGEWRSAESVAADLVAAFGAPEAEGGALALTESALRTLAGHAIVELDGDTSPTRSTTSA